MTFFSVLLKIYTLVPSPPLSLDLGIHIGDAPSLSFVFQVDINDNIRQ